MKQTHSPAIWILQIFLLTALLAGCALPTGEDSKEKIAVSDVHNAPEIVMYLIGDTPNDLDLMLSSLDEMLLEDLQCTLDIRFVPWMDYDVTYETLLSSAQPIDLIYTSQWLRDKVFARANAFLPLNDLLEERPALLNAVSQEDWEQCKVGGVIYTIPTIYHEYVDNGLVYREDLRKKYNLEIPDTVEKLEAYLDAISIGEPDLLPTMESIAQSDGFLSFSGEALRQMETDAMFYSWCGLKVGSIQNGQLSYRTITPYYGSPEMLEDLRVYRRWNQKGFWGTQEAQTMMADNRLEALIQGKCAAVLSGMNASKWGFAMNRVADYHPDWEIGYVCYGVTNGAGQVSGPTQNGMAIPTSAQNPEKALAVYEKLYIVEKYNHLTQYGIEGVHYTRDNKTYLTTERSKDYPYEGLQPWSWRNPFLMLWPKAYEPVQELFALQDTLPSYNTDGFTENRNVYNPVAMKNVYALFSDLLSPLSEGDFEDVDAAYAEFCNGLATSGLTEIQQEYSKQWLAYCDENELP